MQSTYTCPCAICLDFPTAASLWFPLPLHYATTQRKRSREESGESHTLWLLLLFINHLHLFLFFFFFWSQRNSYYFFSFSVAYMCSLITREWDQIFFLKNLMMT